MRHLYETKFDLYNLFIFNTFKNINTSQREIPYQLSYEIIQEVSNALSTFSGVFCDYGVQK